MSTPAETDRIELTGSDAAPILVFDEVPICGLTAGMGRIVLAARVHTEGPDGKPSVHRRVVAHLHGSPAAFHALRDAINGLDLISAGPGVPRGQAN